VRKLPAKSSGVSRAGAPGVTDIYRGERKKKDGKGSPAPRHLAKAGQGDRGDATFLLGVQCPGVGSQGEEGKKKRKEEGEEERVVAETDSIWWCKLLPLASGPLSISHPHRTGHPLGEMKEKERGKRRDGDGKSRSLE